MNYKPLYYLAGAGFLAAAAYVAYTQFLGSKATAQAKANRQIAGCKPTGCMLLSGLGASEVLNFDVPIFETGYYKSTDRTAILQKINLIRSTYATSINQAAQLTNVPADVIAAFIFIESNGVEYAVNGNAVGLMQLDAAGVTDMLFLENKNKRLSEAEKAVLRKYMGYRLNQVLAMRYMGDGGSYVLNTDLIKPEFNILCGAIYLGILIDEETQGNNIRMDKVVVRYNRGYFNKPGTGTYAQVLAKQPTTTANYILKLLGQHGAMDVMIT